MALPSGYQRLAWVSCNGKSFLSTRAPANQDTRIEMEVCLDSAASGGTALFGARTAADSLTFAVYLMGDNRLFYGYGNAYKFQPIDSSLERLKVDASKNTVTIEGTNTYTTTLTYVNFQTQYDLILCGCQTPTGYGSGMTGIVLGARRYDGGSLSDDFCPCVNAEGIAGFWDDVKQEFRTSDGTEEFIAGPVVDPPIYSGFRRLLYISTDGTAWANLRFKPTSTMRVVAKMQMLTNANSQFFFGCRASGNSDQYDCLIASGAFRSGYGTSQASFSLPLTNVYEIDMNGAKCSMNGTTVTHAAQTFTSLYDLYLFASNTAGSAAYPAKARCWEMRVYDGARLIHNFMPYIKHDDVVGIIDTMTGEFISSDGIGEFIAGPIVYENGNDEYTTLLLHGDDIVDSSQSETEISNNGVTISNNGGRFGQGALSFSSQTYLTMPPADFGTGDFTVDWWELVEADNAGTRFANIFADTLETTGGLLIGVYENGAMMYASTGANHSWDILGASACFLKNAPNRWTHRAIVRSAGALMCFTNGTMEYMYNIGDKSIGVSPTKQSVIGAWTPAYMQAGYYYVGYMDEFRISNVARWVYDFIPSDREYASPEDVPTAPAVLSVSYTDDAKANLTWSKVSNAEKYRIYRDMGLIAETDTTSYTDAETLTPYAHEYAVTGVNEFGESRLSDAMRAESWGVVAPNLIFDRTLADIETAKTLMTKRLTGMMLTAEEEEAWDKGLRGCYNTSDVNRVEYHTRELQGILNANGYNIRIDTRLWAKSDIMRYSDIVRYLGNINTILDAFGRSANAPALPTIEKWIDYIAANDIEKILLATRELIYGALAMFRRAGAFTAGNDYHAQIIRRA